MPNPSLRRRDVVANGAVLAFARAIDSSDCEQRAGENTPTKAKKDCLDEIVTLEQFNGRQYRKRYERDNEESFDPEHAAHVGVAFRWTKRKVA
jgi:hypothetical protein